MPNGFYFLPWTKQFYFSAGLVDGSRKFNYMFAPYTKKVILPWFLWRKFAVIRRLFKCSDTEMPDLFKKVSDVVGLQNAYCQVNTGTEGPDQKMTIYAYDVDGKEFFIKVGATSKARQLIENEAETLRLLPPSIRAPYVKNLVNDGNNCILITEAIKAKKYTETLLNNGLLKLIIEIGKIKTEEKEEIIYCFSHGDCCPWNLLINDKGQIIFIDWEFGGMYPLGYDIITYIFRTSFLLEPNKDVAAVLKEHYHFIEGYYRNFKIHSFNAYVNAIVRKQIDWLSNKNENAQIEKWVKLSLLMA